MIPTENDGLFVELLGTGKESESIMGYHNGLSAGRVGRRLIACLGVVRRHNTRIEEQAEPAVGVQQRSL